MQIAINAFSFLLVTLQMDAVPSGDVPLAILRHRLADANNFEEKIEIINKIQLIIKVFVYGLLIREYDRPLLPVNDLTFNLSKS